MEAYKLAVLLGSQARNSSVEWNKLISQAVIWLGSHWSRVDPGQADVFIVFLDGTAESLEHWVQCTRENPIERIIVAGLGELPPEAEWTLPMAPGQSLPGLIDTVMLLSRLEESLVLVDTEFSSAGIFDLNSHIQSIVIESLLDQVCRVCELGDAHLYISPRENICYVQGSLEQSLSFCLAQRQDIKVVSIDEEELIHKLSFVNFHSRLSKYAKLDGVDLIEGAGTQQTQRYSLDELLWFATLVNSEGRPMAEYDYDSGYKLKTLPEFTADVRYQAYQELIQVWAGDFCGFSTLSALTQASRRQIVDFHNACALMDWFYTKAAEIAETQAIEFSDETEQEPIAWLESVLDLKEENNSKLLDFSRVQPKDKSYTNSIETLYKKLRQNGKNSGNKIIFAGMKGAGKSSAMRTLDELVRQVEGYSDKSLFDGAKHKVSVSFAEIHLKDMILFVYGTPGVRRLEFMGHSLCENAWGLILLIDNSADDPLSELDYYLDLYHECKADMRVAIAVTHFDKSNSPGLDDYQHHLDHYHFGPPAWLLDPRSTESLLAFLNNMADLKSCSPQTAWQAA